jgi:hypothetical protein
MAKAQKQGVVFDFASKRRFAAVIELAFGAAVA